MKAFWCSPAEPAGRPMLAEASMIRIIAFNYKLQLRGKSIAFNENRRLFRRFSIRAWPVLIGDFYHRSLISIVVTCNELRSWKGGESCLGVFSGDRCLRMAERDSGNRWLPRTSANDSGHIDSFNLVITGRSFWSHCPPLKAALTTFLVWVFASDIRKSI